MPLNVVKVKSGWSGIQGMLHDPIRAKLDAPGVHETVTGAEGSETTEGPNLASADHDFTAWVLGPAARVPPVAARTGLQAVLFDLDGVLVDTAEFHYLGWKRLADELGVGFDRRTNQAFRGVGRMECLEKLLGEHGCFFADQEKQLLADRKNAYYLEQVLTLQPRHLSPGVAALVAGLKGASHGGVRLAVVSASRNTRLVLGRLGIVDWFDVIIDGNDVTRGKPDPQGFLLAAERLRVRPDRCVVVEDAESGARAALAAGMGVLGIGEAVTSAPCVVRQVTEVTVDLLERLCPDPAPVHKPLPA